MTKTPISPELSKTPSATPIINSGGNTKAESKRRLAVSVPYATSIRNGIEIPHPRYWARLEQMCESLS
jgi:hypothetical protein